MCIGLTVTPIRAFLSDGSYTALNTWMMVST